MIGKPLTKDEVPQKLWGVYDFESQRIEFSLARKKRAMTIKRICLQCKKEERTRVSIIRDSLRGNKLTGLCRRCVTTQPRNPPCGEKHYAWKGGRITLKSGYVMLRRVNHPNAKNGYEFEHRLVMEKILGRYLLPGETVHHKNGVKGENGSENLELWSVSHSNGIRYEDMSIEQLENLIGYAQEVLEEKREIISRSSSVAV